MKSNDIGGNAGCALYFGQVTLYALSPTFRIMERLAQGCLDANGGHFQNFSVCHHISQKEK